MNKNQLLYIVQSIRVTTKILFFAVLTISLFPHPMIRGLLLGPATALAQATPNLQSFTTTTPNGTYGNGDPIEICANYDQVLEVGSTLDVTLDTGTTLTLNHFDQSIGGNITPDATFSVGTGVNSNVRALALQSDGKVIISGEFSHYDGTAATRIARINDDGTLDATFNTNLGVGLNNYAEKIVVQPDGKIIIGGHFTTVNGTIRNRIARLNADGTLDTAFDPNPNNVIYSLALQTDDKIIISGQFTQVDGTNSTRIARLNSDGTYDTGFVVGTGLNNYAEVILVQDDGKIILGGHFSSYDGTTRNRIARLNADGTLDAAFDPNANNAVWSAALQTDGKIIISGQFSQVDGTNSSLIARLNSDGTYDAGFSVGTGLNNYAEVIVPQSDGKILFGGHFSQYNGATAVRLARINTDGSLDTTFSTGGAGANGQSYGMALQPDGKVIIGGTFSSINGTNINRIARLDGNDNQFQTPDQQVCATYTVIPNNTSTDLTVTAITSADVTTTAGGNSTATTIPSGQNLGDNTNLVIKTFAPGGVGDQGLIWLMADRGTNTMADGGQMQTWRDNFQGLTVNAFTTSTGSGIASNSTFADSNYVADDQNFNPSIDIAGTGGFYLQDSGLVDDSTPDMTMISVVHMTHNGDGQLMAFLRNAQNNGDNPSIRINDSRFNLLNVDGNSVQVNYNSDWAKYEYYITSGSWEHNNGGVDFFSDGFRISSTTSATGRSGPRFRIFRDNDNFENSEGFLSEAIVYTKKLTDAEHTRVNSYLAIKYGRTLRSYADASVVSNYLASDATVVWNATANATYSNDIAGIARDDDSGLDQPKSKSVNANAIVTIDHGVTLGADSSFMLWGHNDLDASAWLSDTIASGYPEGRLRLTREWMVQETGTVGPVRVSVQVDDPDLDLPQVLGALYLLVDSNNNGDFSDEATIRMTAQGGGVYTANADFDFQDGQRFTFATAASGLRGVVFQDDNTDGQSAATENGLGGVIVTAVDANGVITTTTTDLAGNYAFIGGGGLSGSTRVTFTLPITLQTSMQPTVFGRDHRTTVQFVYMGGNGWTVANAGFTFQNRTSACANPTIASACYTAGPGTADPGVFSFEWTTGADVNNPDAASQDVGAVWGSAINTNSGRMYSAAMLKRHVGLGPLAARAGNNVTVDGVYIIDYSTSGGTFNTAAPGFTLQGVSGIDLGTVQRVADTNSELDNDYELLPGQSVDLDAYGKVGTVGFGDADIAPDGSLWLVNLNQRTLIRVDTNGLPNDGSAAPAANVTTTPITDPGCSGDFRPWALTFYEGTGYLGVICSAETSGSRADLHAYVRSFDPNNPGTFTTVVDFPLDFTRENIYILYGANRPVPSSDWLPWTDTYRAISGFVGSSANPQPILSDIEFNIDGNMILGFMDRFGHQTHQTNLEALPLAQDPQVRSFVTAGDMVNFCASGTGWIIEGSSPDCPEFDQGGVRRVIAGGAAGPFEFYAFDEAGACVDHIFYFETYGGSTCVGPDGRSMLSTVYFPGGESSGVPSNSANDYGFRTFSTDNGSMLRPYAAALPDGLMCANGQTHNMGELTCFCPPPPVEIGSSVWQDSNVNGIQDPGEPGIEGVTVELVDSGGTVIATATTDARGEYFFSSDDGTSTANTIYNLDIPGTGVSVRIPNATGGSQQPSLAGHAPSPSDQGSDDTVDSDIVPTGDDAVIAADTTGGRIDHSYDFGFAPDIWDVALRKSTSVQYAQSGGTVVFAIEVFNQSIGPIDNIDVIDYVPTNLTANDANWTPATQAGPNTVTRMLNAGDELPATGLLPGESVVVDITMDVAGGLADNTVLVNTAEVSAFTTFGGGTVTDIDSTPDTTDNETNVKDGVINEDGLNNAGDDEDDHDIEQITITAQTDIYDLALVKGLATGQDAVVSVNSDVRFTIEVFNQGTSPASNIVVVDRYPAGFTLSPNDGSWTDVGGTSATRALGVTLQPGQSTTVDIILRAGTTTGAAMNYAEIQSDDGDDVDSQPEGDENDNNGDALIDDVTSDNGTLDEDDHDVATVTVQNFDLALRKTLTAGQPTTTVRGADITYMIEVFNQGTVPAFDISVIDYLTDTLQLSENDGNGWTQVEPNLVVKNIPGPIAPLESEQIMITLRVSDTATLGALDNLAEILNASASPGGPPADDTDSTPDDGRGNDPLVDDQILDDGTTDEDDHDIATVTVGRFDLALIKEYVSDTSRDGNATDGIIGIGDQVVFRMTVTNQGDVPAYDIRVTDHNPEGIVADDSDPALNIDNGWLTENMVLNHNVLPGPLNPTESVTIDIVLRSVPPSSILYPAGGLLGTHTNIAEISSASNLPSGPPVVDDDSTPDEDPTNDAGGTPGSAADDVIDGDGTGPVPGTDAGTDEDDHDPAQITVQNTFDLALFKYVVDADGRPIAGIPEVQAGDFITYQYYVENQGTEAATSITLIEHVPEGLILVDSNWTPSNVTGPGTATRTYSNALAPGDFFTDTVIFQAAPTITPGQVYTNIMEIQSATNVAGLTDTDSDPDTNATNETFVEDNQIFDNFRLDPATMDEDDHDPAAVQTAALEQVVITKTLATSGTIQTGQSLSFTIRIENVGGAPIATLPLTDTYDTTYLAYNTLLGATPPADMPDENDGQLNWSDVTGNSTFELGDVLTVTVNFFAAADTTALADDTNCTSSTAGQTVNIATIDASKAITPTSCVGVTIKPPEGKSTIGDWIWHDINNDGIKDPNEPGINGVRVNLYEDGANGGTLNGQIEAAEFVTFTITADDVNGLGDDTSGTNGAGFYQFEVPAEDGDFYIVEVDASNFDPGGPLAGFVYSGDQGGQQYSGTQPRVVPVATAPLAPPENQNVDFGFYCRFDLALDKQLTSADNIKPGDNMTFTMTVYNQGVVTATDVVVADYIPVGFTLNDSNWNGGTVDPNGVSGTVTRTLAATLTPSGTANSMATVDIMLTAGATLSGTFTNTAEIANYASVITDTLGNNLPDADSDPDTNDTEDPVKDDVIDEDGKNNPVVDDEDDHDPATITVIPFTPSLAVSKELNTTPSDPSFGVNEIISYTIRITNTGDVTITVLPLEDRYSDVFIEFQSASVNPDLSQPGLLMWNDLTAALGDVGPGDNVSLTVSFETMADTTLLQPVAPCTSGGHTPNIVDIDGAFADPDGDDGTGDDIAVVKDVDDHDCAEVQILNPTAIQLAEMSVSQTSEGVVIQWATVTEVDIAGFRIHRVNGIETLEVEVREVGTSTAIHGLIPAKKSGQNEGSRYSVLHAGATLSHGDAYVLEVIKMDSSVERTVVDMVSGGEIFLPMVVR
ncbi:MAG: SdrD B-like domain-containing protein [Chloroflexota bacterium]